MRIASISTFAERTEQLELHLHVQLLHHFFACTLPRVGDIDRNLQRIVQTKLLGTQPQWAIAEDRVGIVYHPFVPASIATFSCKVI